MIRMIMRWYLGVCTDLLTFTLQLRKTQKTSARRQSDEGTMRPFIASNGIPYLQMRSAGSHCTLGREKEGKGKFRVWITVLQEKCFQHFSGQDNATELLGRPRRRWKNNIRINNVNKVNWLELSQERDFLNTFKRHIKSSGFISHLLISKLLETVTWSHLYCVFP